MKCKLSFALIAMFLLSTVAVAQEVPMDLQIQLLLKIASMDRKFDRFGDPVKIGVSSDRVFSSLKAQEGKLTVKAKAFVVEKMNALDDIANFKIVYVDNNWKNNYAAAADKAKGSQTLIFCADEEYVMSGGGAVSFKVVDGKPKIVINLNNSKLQGSDFPADFLKITVVVGGL